MARRQLQLGDGLWLQALGLPDAAALFARIAAERQRLLTWQAWPQRIAAVADVQRYLAASERAWAVGEARRFAIWVEQDIAGVASLESVDVVRRCCRIGYWIGAPWEGLGYVSRSVQALVQEARALGLRRAELAIAPHNRRSRALAERLGFTQMALLARQENLLSGEVDHLLYGFDFA